MPSAWSAAVWELSETLAMADFNSHDGCRIHFSTTGEGEPLVFIHGWAMSSRVWQFQADDLSSRYRVITPDLRGHGLSEAPPFNILSLADMASDLLRLFEQFNSGRAVLVGWSLGSLVVLEAFPALRERLKAIVLVGGTPRFTACDGYAHGLSPNEVRGMALRLKRDYVKTMGEFFRGMFAPAELSRGQNQKMVNEIILPGRNPSPDIALQGLDILAKSDLRAVLAKIDRPALLLHGREDMICPATASRYMADRIPGASLELFQGCGHAPFMSRPAEFTRSLETFLEKVNATV